MFKIIPEKRMILSLINLNIQKCVVPQKNHCQLKDKKNKKNEVIYGRSEILETNDKFKTIPREEQYEGRDF
jgi:hypothetical protein